jgi:hypothetical protein
MGLTHIAGVISTVFCAQPTNRTPMIIKSCLRLKKTVLLGS